ncbi:hypothetical protein CYMTET_49895 [Cymbomonas tetramitiformis]|uniref:Mechanosensitive ion channel MscS domain-containing protein n=1 Tax=Cymbomonas tetramitiformis TaxID=36881 RepID=A0AAE0BR93_9CHLO|nr:hypothetical protein CYMTET_49895 [Cymbomonas tetramitiformis]
MGSSSGYTTGEFFGVIVITSAGLILWLWAVRLQKVYKTVTRLTIHECLQTKVAPVKNVSSEEPELAKVLTVVSAVPSALYLYCLREPILFLLGVAFLWFGSFLGMGCDFYDGPGCREVEGEESSLANLMEHELSNVLGTIVANFLKLCAVFGSTFVFHRIVDAWAMWIQASYNKNSVEGQLIGPLTRCWQIFLGAVAFALALHVFNWDNTLILFGYFFAFLAYFFKDGCLDLAGSYKLVLQHSFDLGDWITVGNVDGFVESIGIAHTNIRAFDQTIQTMQNRFFMSDTVINHTRVPSHRLVIKLRFGVSTPVSVRRQFAEDVKTAVFPRHNKVLVEKTYVEWKSPLDLTIYCFSKLDTQMFGFDVYSELSMMLFEHAEDNNVHFAVESLAEKNSIATYVQHSPLYGTKAVPRDSDGFPTSVHANSKALKSEQLFEVERAKDAEKCNLGSQAVQQSPFHKSTVIPQDTAGFLTSVQGHSRQSKTAQHLEVEEEATLSGTG